MKFRSSIGITISAILTTLPVSKSWSQSIKKPLKVSAVGNANGNANGGSTTGNANGNANGGSTTGGTSTTGGSSTTGGTTGNGTGPGQGAGVGNDTPGGNTGNGTPNHTTGSSTGGTSTTGGSSTGSSTNGNANGNSNGGGTTGGSTTGGTTGNGVGPGQGADHGNDTPGGNTGNGTPNHTTGSSTGGTSTTGGSSTGSSTNGNANGNANGGTTGGSSTNGNANGNANGGTNGQGPGNGADHGNDTPGGNTGNGTPNHTTGSTNGGTTGSTTGGNTTGSTTGGNTTGSTTGGTTTGSETTGSTTGGTTTGSETTGLTTGGSTTGSETTGGTTGGNTTGGTTGEETTGSTAGGETNGDTTGGDTTGGDTTGGDEGGSTGENTTQPTENKPEKKLKARVLPLVFGNYDIFKKIVNLTTSEVQTANTPVILDDYRNGFQVSQMRQYELGLGMAPQLFVENATGLMALSTGVVGLSAIKDRMVQYERFVSSEEEALNIKVLPIPYKAEQLSSYKTGESVYFENMGGMLFIGGVGVAGAFTGGSVVAEGGFKTLVTKTGQTNVTVNLVKSNIRKVSLFTGVAVLKVDATSNAQINNGFSYSFDLTQKSAAKAYEQLLAGNAIPAQDLAKNGVFTGVVSVDSTANRQVTRSRGISLGIPMVFMQTWTTGKTYGQTDTVFFNDNSKTELNYGVYFKENNGRFFHTHKKLVRTFYSGHAVNKSSKGAVVSQDQLATYLWSYENDNAKSNTFAKAVNTFHKDLGLRASFNPSVVAKEYLGFMRLEAQIDIPASYTKSLMNTTAGREFADVMSKRAISLVSKYFSQGDVDQLCMNEDDEETNGNENCKDALSRETVNALGKIKSILVQMKDAKDGATFTALHAQMGKEFTRNQFVLGSLMALDTKCEVKFKVKLEGQRMNRLNTTVPANPACR